MEYRGPQILRVHADLLRAFWAKNGNRHDVSPQEWVDVIADMQQLGLVKIIYTNPGITREKARAKFDKVKDDRVRYRLFPGQLCLACGEAARVRHHLIWLKNGGRNNKRNICYLCHDCHAQVHPWLQSKN